MANERSQTTPPMGPWFSTQSGRYTVAGVVAGFVFPVVASFIKVAELGLPSSLTNLLVAQGGEPLLWITDTAPFFLGLLAGIAGRRQDLAAEANRLLAAREAEVNASRTNLEENVAQRTTELNKRNAEMRSIITFARQIAEIQDLPTLLTASVQIISQRLEGYAANLYMLDESGHLAVLRASSAEAGKGLLADGYRVVVGDQSVVGRVARRGKSLISQPRAESTSELNGTAPLSPRSSQVGLPLMAQGRVIGVLEVLVQRPEPVDQNEAEMLQLLADQLAASIENARLATASRATVDQLASLTSEGTRKAWGEYLQNNTVAYQFTPAGVRPAVPNSEADRADRQKIPVLLRGQEIGSISLQRKSNVPWTDTERDLLEKLATQLGLALENARLIEETRQRASQEQAVSEISARFSRSLDVDALLQVAVREFAALPEVAEATVVLKPTDEPGAPTRR